MTSEKLREDYDQLQREAVQLAGGLTDLSQRATVYRHLFLTSNGNHTFPLIAAHGALWAGGYFRFGLKLGSILSWQYIGQRDMRRNQLRRLAAFADVFRDINRRVCIDSYVNFHFTRRHGLDPHAVDFVPFDLLEPLNRMHAASNAGRNLTDSEKRDVFVAHFLHEQANVVGPTLADAVAEFDWPLAKAIALRPLVRFSYFPGQLRLWFRDFASREERIEKGLTAFNVAANVGWANVDAALRRYQVLPEAFFAAPAVYFNELRATMRALS